ncbi:hypothetical protein F2Q69_00062871 [Brassica cretica]|uniref:Uncharacterized protein n=2 Tax=Brassica cretica TaxID=69181 RepID=A0A3N6RUP8_BRACR|nr:hypothetical protein DY000_02057235 [Brassica cretica]KAF3574433.1 hypothetical protein F2Q69_00062871 [Brassica cretica]
MCVWFVILNRGTSARLYREDAEMEGHVAVLQSSRWSLFISTSEWRWLVDLASEPTPLRPESLRAAEPHVFGSHAWG